MLKVDELTFYKNFVLVFGVYSQLLNWIWQVAQQKQFNVKIGSIGIKSQVFGEMNINKYSGPIFTCMENARLGSWDTCILISCFIIVSSRYK